jgi:hypothetical protein
MRHNAGPGWGSRGWNWLRQGAGGDEVGLEVVDVGHFFGGEGEAEQV